MMTTSVLDEVDARMLRDASVKLTASTDSNNKPVAEIEINGEFTHRFPTTSRVSQALETTPVKALETRLNGGQFFVVNRQLVDFRDGRYGGFVHDDANIDALLRVIGFSEGRPGTRSTQTARDIVLGRSWNDHPFEVPMYQEGGRFTSNLEFRWNPFVRTVNSAFQITRLVCSNGMMGLANFLNTRIPLENRWEEHLDIAAKQIQHKIDAIMQRRLGEMGRERATVGDLLRLSDHVADRVTHKENAHVASRLRKIGDAVNVRAHLGKVYKDSVFEDRRLAAQMPGHLTMFDAYNVATEIASHTNEAKGSSDHALDKFANDIVFSRKSKEHGAARFMEPPVASFSDAEAAFFGEMA